MELAVYFGLIAALFVRFRSAGEGDVPAPMVLRAPEAELRLVRWHHRLFYLVLGASLVEYFFTSRPSLAVELIGISLFAGGLVLYRVGGRTLGTALSPLISPGGPRFCERGIYRVVRHPMYLGELLMASGAPLVLGCYLSLILALPVAAVTLVRLSWEERMWLESCPDYALYRKRVSSLIPFIF